MKTFSASPVSRVRILEGNHAEFFTKASVIRKEWSAPFSLPARGELLRSIGLHNISGFADVNLVLEAYAYAWVTNTSANCQ